MFNVEFKFELGSAVKSPLCIGAVKKVKHTAGGNYYKIVNNIQGISDQWWHERFLSDPPAVEEEGEKEA